MLPLLERLEIVCAHTEVRVQALAGGVSSDIFRVEAPGATLCVKRALPKLKVAQDWRVPTDRNRYEAEWMRVAGALAPASVPRLLAEDRASGALAMEWLPPDRYPVWKAELAEGRIDPARAAQVGAALGRIHAGTADQAGIAQRFGTDELFRALRLDPYLDATAQRHADLADRLRTLARTTAATRRVLVHGDFSPKNILIGPDGPVILDAECAWFGDPAFDLAFVTNHLLLKGVWKPQWRERYAEALGALVDAYRPAVGWEAFDTLEARTAALVPALMLARVDGKSPVEYLANDSERAPVRAFARAQLASAGTSLRTLTERWLRFMPRSAS
jgi:5-methylthioribose kinase